MNKDQAKGRVKDAVGKTKEVAVNSLRVRGVGEKAAGKVQSSYGDAKDALDKDKK
jgi:uncharacterized protein YjbJ (UPF0337 family)